MYGLVGLPPPDYLNFLLAPHPESRLPILTKTKHHILFGPAITADNPAEKAAPPSASQFDRVCAMLEASCTDGGADEFTPACRKCRTNEFVEFEFKQTRSADEGMTIEYECGKCKSKWRE
jgi:DNA-directed RNA polymerase subunit M/transcription elongation factor TFIIS